MDNSRFWGRVSKWQRASTSDRQGVEARCRFFSLACAARLVCVGWSLGLLPCDSLDGGPWLCAPICVADELDHEQLRDASGDERPPEPMPMRDPVVVQEPLVEVDSAASTDETVAEQAHAVEAITEQPQVPTDRVTAESEKAVESAESPEAIQAAPQAETQPVIDEAARPQWVEMLPIREGEVHATAVCSGPHHLRDLESALHAELKVQTDAYIQEYLGSVAATSFPALNLDIDRIRRDLVVANKSYREPVKLPDLTSRYGDLYQEHALLEFDADFRHELDRKWNGIVKTSHLKLTGIGCLSVLMCLGVLIGYFRLDTATRGFYTVRLQFVTAIAILTLVGVGVVIASWIPWV